VVNKLSISLKTWDKKIDLSLAHLVCYVVHSNEGARHRLLGDQRVQLGACARAARGARALCVDRREVRCIALVLQLQLALGHQRAAETLTTQQYNTTLYINTAHPPFLQELPSV
jgi:hypothetical protein